MANSPARQAIDVGSVIADTYKIEALIGRGGMGAVFLASHARLPGKQVAIKLLHADVHEPEVLLRFRREAEIASRLGHPNIVAVHDFNVTPDGMPYLVLELLQGATLAHKLKDGPLPIEQTLSIVRQIGSALAAAHREGIVHRDLKPHNIFLVPTEVDGRVVEIAKVLDFGISKIRGSQTVKTQETALLGTPQYMAPEQAMGQHGNVDERTDVFALGAIVHEMLSGQPAFTGDSIPEVVFKVVYEAPSPLPATVPEYLASAVRQAMAKPAAERFPNVGAFVEALTGQPLSLLRPALLPAPDVGFATGSKNVSNQDALANTMDSGDYARPPPQAIIGGPLVPASAQTQASLTPRSIELDRTHVSAQPPIMAPPPATPAPPARRVWPLVAVAAGAVAVTAVVMFFAFGGGGDTPPAKPKVAVVDDTPSAPAAPVASVDTKPVDPAPSDTKPNPFEAKPADTKPADTKPADTKPVDTKPADTKPADAKPVGTKPADTKPATSKPTQPPTPDEPSSGDDSALGDLLADAEAAFSRGEKERALRITNRIVNDGQGTRVAALAHVLRGRIYCDDNLMLARAELRSIPRRFPRLIKQLQATCASLR